MFFYILLREALKEMSQKVEKVLKRGDRCQKIKSQPFNFLIRGGSSDFIFFPHVNETRMFTLYASVEQNNKIVLN